MKGLIAFSAGLLFAGTAFAAGGLMNSVPSSSLTVTDWYKQSVYDPNNNKVGEVMDVLVASDGKIDALIIGVGGFLGAGEKDVAVSFGAVRKTKKDNGIVLTMNASKEELKAAPGFKYDKQTTTWVPETRK